MTQPFACDEAAEGQLAMRYLAGTLAAEQEDRFEEHLLGCARCQDELRFMAAAGEALRERKRRRRSLWPAGMAVAAAAGLVALLIVRPQAGQHLTKLGALDAPPIYLGMAVRSEDTRVDSLFDAAMQAYEANEYDEAVATFDAALAAGAERPPVEFFQAASLLMLNRAERAARTFGRVIGYGDTPYLPEAHFYRAKARLRLGRAADAMADLRWLAAQDHELASHARALADSVEAVKRR